MDNTSKEKIIKSFSEHNVLPDQIAIGCGKAITNGKRYSMRAGKTYMQNNMIKYIVKYIFDHDICIVWKKLGKKHVDQIIPRNVFSVKADEVNAIIDSGTVTKSVEFVNRYQEKVLICRLDSLQEYLKHWLVSY